MFDAAAGPDMLSFFKKKHPGLLFYFAEEGEAVGNTTATDFFKDRSARKVRSKCVGMDEDINDLLRQPSLIFQSSLFS